VEFSVADFASGSLQRTSYARPGKLFTASGGLIVRLVGTLRPESLARITERVIEILQRPPQK
jgi:mRNA interferase MazF